MGTHALFSAIAVLFYLVVVLPFALFAIAAGGALCLTVLGLPLGLPLIAIGLRLLWL
jgi:hypothetical protein